ncbi:MAG: hypothetical protein IJ880_04650 [Bacilli bacterium]|nr:hypothetical protein [Bacilli bacterium]MBR3119713.1 hypothetical protein [Oceanobacillus sp.]
MKTTNLERLGAELYEIYRKDHTNGYPIKRVFIDNLTKDEAKVLRDSFIGEREKFEKDSFLGHTETFWGMYDELQ